MKEKQRGSIEKGKVSYKLTITLGNDVNGKRIRKYRNVRAKNMDEARKALKEFWDEHNDVYLQIQKKADKIRRIKTLFGKFCKLCEYRNCSNCKAKKFYNYIYLKDI